VISERQLVNDDGDSVTFHYRDGQTQKRMNRTVSGAHFVWLLIQHVLPRGFGRVRDYGFLHGNARRKLIRVQWFLKVSLSSKPPPRQWPAILCSQCSEPMHVASVTLPRRLSGYTTWVRLDLPHSFLPPAWRVHVCDEASPGIYHRRFLEIASLFELAEGFRSASLYVENSSSFADYRNQFHPLESDKVLNDYLHERGLPEKAENFVTDLKQDLSRACHALEQNVYKHKSVQLDANGQPIVPRPLAIGSPPSLQDLERNLKRRLPQRDVLEALYHADQLTGWSRHFRPPARIRSQIDRPATRSVLTAFTYGCGLGPTQAARHFDCDISAKQLRFVNRRHVGVPELRAACTDIIDQYAKYDLPSCWGSGESAAADGSLIATYANNLNAQYHVRYQRVGGIAYRHVADNYIALFSQFIGCGVREAVYILDGVLNYTSSLKPQ